MSTPFSLSLFPSHCFPLPFQLRKTIPDCPSCPLKKRLIVWSPVFLDQRRVELLDWIRTVCLTVLCLRICTSVTCVCVSLSFSVRRVCVCVYMLDVQLARDARVCRSPQLHKFLRDQANVRFFVFL